jgi:hypothetical protein
VVFISILFMLPTLNPINAVNFNYTPVVVLGALILLTIWWLVSVRHWFKGPHVQGTEAQLEDIERSVGEKIIVELDNSAEASGA